MPQVVNTGKRENDYSAGMQMLAQSAERQSKKNQRQAILKNIIRSQGLNADVSDDGEIVFNSLDGKKRISTTEAMNINNVDGNHNLSRENKYDVTSQYDPSVTQTSLDQLAQVQQANTPDPETLATQQATQERIRKIAGGVLKPSGIVSDPNTSIPGNTTSTTNVNVPTAENNLVQSNPPIVNQNPSPLTDLPSNIADIPIQPPDGIDKATPKAAGTTNPTPAPAAGSSGRSEATKEKANYAIGQTTDYGIEGTIKPAVVTQGTVQKGMRDEVQDDYRNLQRKAAIYSALSGLEPTAHNPYAEMAERRAKDLDYFNTNDVGVAKQTMNIQGGEVDVKMHNKVGVNAKEGVDTQVSTNTYTNIGGGGGTRKDNEIALQLADDVRITDLTVDKNGYYVFPKDTNITIDQLDAGSVSRGFESLGYSKQAASGFERRIKESKDENSEWRDKPITVSKGGIKITFINGVFIPEQSNINQSVAAAMGLQQFKTGREQTGG